MNRRQKILVIASMGLLLAPVGEITRILLLIATRGSGYIVRYDGRINLLICELALYWLCWLAVGPVMWFALRLNGQEGR